jgi:hypothetical protein
MIRWWSASSTRTGGFGVALIGRGGVAVWHVPLGDDGGSANIGSFIGSGGTVARDTIAAVADLAAGFVTSDVTNNIISDIGNWF